MFKFNNCGAQTNQWLVHVRPWQIPTLFSGKNGKFPISLHWLRRLLQITLIFSVAKEGITPFPLQRLKKVGFVELTVNCSIKLSALSNNYFAISQCPMQCLMIHSQVTCTRIIYVKVDNSCITISAIAKCKFILQSRDMFIHFITFSRQNTHLCDPWIYSLYFIFNNLLEPHSTRKSSYVLQCCISIYPCEHIKI